MEIGKRFNPRHIFFGLYIVAFLIYLTIGLQPAEAVNPVIVSRLIIPSIGLDSDVQKVELKDHELKTPDLIVGSYSGAENKTLLIGHSSTVFLNLDNTQINDKIFYDGKIYNVDNKETLKKEDVIMPELLGSSDRETIVIMTCAGQDLGSGDASHRLIVTATLF